ncbi:two-component system response regulator [Thermodesulfobacteriota bacterium]
MKSLSDCAILVVDDTEANIDILLEALGDDYDVMVAMDGEDALEMVAEETPDLVLLDVMMPGMNGFEVCQKLKASPDTTDIAVIFLSGRSEKEDMDRGQELGAIDYIIKPFDIQDVRDRVKTHLTNILGSSPD